MTILAPLAMPAFRETIRPRAAFLIYEIDAKLLATVHPLRTTRQEQAVIGVGRPLTQRDLQGWLRDLAGQARAPALTLLPEHLLAFEAGVWVWWRPARRAPMWFVIDSQRYGFRVPWPPLVFIAARQCVWCAALAQNRRPTAQTPLYHAPLMNIDRQGAVCLGSAQPPPSGAPDPQAAWEATVCQTNFAHVSHPQTLTLQDHTAVSTEAHLRFWQGLNGQSRFPTAALVTRNETLTDWLKAVLP